MCKGIRCKVRILCRIVNGLLGLELGARLGYCVGIGLCKVRIGIRCKVRILCWDWIVRIEVRILCRIVIGLCKIRIGIGARLGSCAGLGARSGYCDWIGN